MLFRERISLPDLKRRHLFHPVDGKELRRLDRRAEVEKYVLVWLADILEHPADDAAARHGIG